SAFHGSPVAFVSSREPRHLAVSDVPDIPVPKSLQIPRGFDCSFDIVEVERVAMILVPAANDVIAHYHKRDAAVIQQVQKVLRVLTREDCRSHRSGPLEDRRQMQVLPGHIASISNGEEKQPTITAGTVRFGTHHDCRMKWIEDISVCKNESDDLRLPFS